MDLPRIKNDKWVKARGIRRKSCPYWQVHGEPGNRLRKYKSPGYDKTLLKELGYSDESDQEVE